MHQPKPTTNSPLAVIRETYHSQMLIPKSELAGVDSMVATILSSKLPRDMEPIALMLVGPSGWGKTEIIRPILDYPGIGIDFSTCTENALSSGSPGASKSLLSRMDRRVLIIPDFTEILDHPDRRRGFFGTVRSAYDGAHNKYSGALPDAIRARLRLTIFAATVPRIYAVIENDQDLGYRYLIVWARKSDSRAYQSMVQNMINETWNNQDHWRSNIKSRVRNALNRIRDRYNTGVNPDPITQEHGEADSSLQIRIQNREQEKTAGWDRIQYPAVNLTPEYAEWVSAASRILTAIRLGSGNADRAREDTPTYTGLTERPAPFRAQKQLNVLCTMRALADFRTYTDESDIEFGRAIARDTIPPSRLLMMDALYRNASHNKRGLVPGILAGTINRDPDYTSTVIEHLLRTEFFITDSDYNLRLAPEVLEDIKTARLAPRTPGESP